VCRTVAGPSALGQRHWYATREDTTLHPETGGAAGDAVGTGGADSAPRTGVITASSAKEPGHPAAPTLTVARQDRPQVPRPRVPCPCARPLTRAGPSTLAVHCDRSKRWWHDRELEKVPTCPQQHRQSPRDGR